MTTAIEAYLRMKTAAAEEELQAPQRSSFAAPALGAGVGAAVGGGGGLLAAAHNNKDLIRQFDYNRKAVERLAPEANVEGFYRRTLNSDDTAKSILKDMKRTALRRDLLPAKQYAEQMGTLKQKLRAVDEYGLASKKVPVLGKRLLKSVGKHTLIGAGALGGAGLLGGLAYNHFKD